MTRTTAKRAQALAARRIVFLWRSALFGEGANVFVEKIDCDNRYQEHSREDTRRFRGSRQEMQAILKNAEKEKPEDRSEEIAASTKDRGSTDDDGSDCLKFEAGAEIGFSQPKMGYIDDCGETGNCSRQEIDEGQIPSNGDAGVVCPLGVQPDGIESPPDDRPVEKNAVDENEKSEEEDLDRNLPEISLA